MREPHFYRSNRFGAVISAPDNSLAEISRSILAKKVSFMNGLGGGFSTLIDVVSFSNEIISKNRIIVDDYARVSSTPSKWVK